MCSEGRFGYGCFFHYSLIKEVITMRLRNVFVLGAFTAMSLGTIACGKKTEEMKPADSVMAPAPAAPAPATPAPAATPAPDTTKKGGDMKGGDMKKDGMKK
jgi:hypothetical protein